MTAAEKLIAFIRNSFDTALYFAVMAVKENFRNYVGRAGTVGRPAQSMVILGNGPSLAGDLPRLIERREYETEDFLAVNFFAEDDRFEVVKPKYYVLSDPMFFRDSACRDRVRALYAMLARKVAWPMNLYVQYYNPEGFDYRAALPNSNIRIVRFHTQMYRGFRSLEFWLFRRGLGSANFGTVVQVGEYVALLLGYKRIELYGVDHTLLDGLCVDDGNRLCRIDRHYYDGAEAAAPQPIYKKVPHVPYTMADYLAEVADPAVPPGPQGPREDEEGAGFDIHRLDGLRAGDVFGRIVERPPLVPCERLYLFGAECRVVFARNHFPERIRDGLGADKGRRGVRQHIEVGFDLGGEAVVNLPSQRRVAVQLLAAAQEPHPFGQEFADPLVAAIDVNLVDSLDLGQRSEYVAHERRPAQRTQVLAADALAVEPYGDECCCFHNSVLYRGLPALRRKPV